MRSIFARYTAGTRVLELTASRGDGTSCAGKLGWGGSWVVGVTVWVLEGLEGRPLVFVQRDTVLDAQRQVGLEPGGS